jgi:hypothetical protein
MDAGGGGVAALVGIWGGVSLNRIPLMVAVPGVAAVACEGVVGVESIPLGGAVRAAIVSNARVDAVPFIGGVDDRIVLGSAGVDDNGGVDVVTARPVVAAPVGVPAVGVDGELLWAITPPAMVATPTFAVPDDGARDNPLSPNDAPLLLWANRCDTIGGELPWTSGIDERGTSVEVPCVGVVVVVATVVVVIIATAGVLTVVLVGAVVVAAALRSGRDAPGNGELAADDDAENEPVPAMGGNPDDFRTLNGDAAPIGAKLWTPSDGWTANDERDGDAPGICTNVLIGKWFDVPLDDDVPGAVRWCSLTMARLCNIGDGDTPRCCWMEPCPDTVPMGYTSNDADPKPELLLWWATVAGLCAVLLWYSWWVHWISWERRLASPLLLLLAISLLAPGNGDERPISVLRLWWPCADDSPRAEWSASVRWLFWTFGDAFGDPPGDGRYGGGSYGWGFGCGSPY